MEWHWCHNEPAGVSADMLRLTESGSRHRTIFRSDDADWPAYDNILDVSNSIPSASSPNPSLTVQRSQHLQLPLIQPQQCPNQYAYSSHVPNSSPLTDSGRPQTPRPRPLPLAQGPSPSRLPAPGHPPRARKQDLHPRRLRFRRPGSSHQRESRTRERERVI